MPPHKHRLLNKKTQKPIAYSKIVSLGIIVLMSLIFQSVISLPKPAFAAANSSHNQRATLPPEWTATFTASPPAETAVPLPTITLGGISPTDVPPNSVISSVTGKQVLIDVDSVELHTAPSADSSVVEIEPRGSIKELLDDVKNPSDNVTWFYVRDGFGWIPSTINGLSTVRDYSDEALMQMLSEVDGQLKNDGQNAMLTFRKGWLHFNQQNFDLAVSEMSSAIDLMGASANADPKEYARLFDYRGLGYVAKADNSSALKDFNEAITRGLKDAATYEHRAYAYQGLKQYAEARADFEQAIRIDPAYGLLYTNYGSLITQINTNDPAQLDYFSKGIEVDPYLPYGYAGRAIYYLKIGDTTDHVVKDLVRALQFVPHDKTILINLASLYVQRQQLSLAEQEYHLILQLDPDYVIAYIQLGGIYATMGNPDAAVKNLLIAIKKGDQSGTAYYNLGTVLAGQGQYAAALYCFNKSLAINPARNAARINREAVLKRSPGLDENTIMSAPSVEALISSAQ